MMSSRKAQLVALGIAAIAILIFWFVSRALETLNHIVPSRGIALSTSMEPYELDFRVKNRSGKISEWKLAVPRAYITDETGLNGALGPQTGQGKEDVYFSSSLTLSLQGENTFVPRTLIDHSGNLPSVVSIGISNSTGQYWIRKNDLCVPGDLRHEIAKKYDSASSNINCDDRDYLCSIEMQLDGWGVGAAVTKDLYKDPERVCSLVKKFLISYTVKRDPQP
jgi:hypothetical protein